MALHCIAWHVGQHSGSGWHGVTQPVGMPWDGMGQQGHGMGLPKESMTQKVHGMRGMGGMAQPDRGSTAWHGARGGGTAWHGARGGSTAWHGMGLAARAAMGRHDEGQHGMASGRQHTAAGPCPAPGMARRLQQALVNC